MFYAEDLAAHAFQPHPLGLQAGLVIDRGGHNAGALRDQDCPGIPGRSDPQRVGCLPAEAIHALQDAERSATRHLQVHVLRDAAVDEAVSHLVKGIVQCCVDLPVLQHRHAARAALQDVGQRPCKVHGRPMARHAMPIHQAKRLPTVRETGDAARVLAQGPIPPTLAAFGVHDPDPICIEDLARVRTCRHNMELSHVERGFEASCGQHGVQVPAVVGGPRAQCVNGRLDEGRAAHLLQVLVKLVQKRVGARRDDNVVVP
mmetsp:Transcript_61754/g.172484  ORF Transcript_61754/g.172484 Transcript_61754/m.172484 type:complete len:259 (-) Transcript_61754:411-1187(-)